MKNEFIETLEAMKKETFVQDAIIKFGVDVVEKGFSRAWEFGHSEGDNSIRSWMKEIIDIMELVK